MFQMALKALITGCLVSAACVSLGVVSAVVAFVVCVSSAPYAIVYAVFYGAAIGGTISVTAWMDHARPDLWILVSIAWAVSFVVLVAILLGGRCNPFFAGCFSTLAAILSYLEIRRFSRRVTIRKAVLSVLIIALLTAFIGIFLARHGFGG